jgi:hypothetical protein
MNLVCFNLFLFLRYILFPIRNFYSYKQVLAISAKYIIFELKKDYIMDQILKYIFVQINQLSRLLIIISFNKYK